MINPESRYIFFIGSYRDNEVYAAHPLMLMFDEIRRENIGLNTITLSPLDITAVNQLISNFLRSDEMITLILAGLIHKKTIGNPFFINQFLKTLYDEKIITLAPVEKLQKAAGSRGGWSWDIEKISAMRVTDNVVELMAEQISRLPAQSRETLKIAACIGSWFDLETVSMIQNISIDNALSCLSDAINEGLIIPQGQKYTFYHDRIQEAAYSLIPQLEKSMMHTRIGRLLLQNTEKNDLNEKILYIVNQLNEGTNLLYTEDERLELARLNLQAGIKAKMTAAYRSALHYIKTGIELINHPNHDDGGIIEKEENYCWEKWYNLSLSLYSEAAEAAYLCTEFNELNIYADAVLANARDIFDKVRIYESLIHKFAAQNRLLDAVSIGLDALKFFNIRFPEKPNIIHLISGLFKIKLSLLGRDINEIYNKPVMKESKIFLAMRLLNCISSSVYWGKPELFPLTVFKFVSLSLKYGNSSFSPYAYAGYGLMLCSIGNIEDGYTFGKMSQRLLEKLDVQDQKSRTTFTFNVFIRHWKEHVNKTLAGCLEGYKAALETGDLEFAFHNSMTYCAYGFLIGKKIADHRRETETYINIADSLKQKSQLHILCLYNQIMINLQTENDAYNLKGPIYDEAIMLPQHISADDHTALSAYYLNKSMLYYLFHKYREAISISIICEKNIDSLVGQLGTVLFYFYDSLICLALCDTAPENEKKQYLRKARKNAKKLKKWGFHAPVNHQHKLDLVLAEIARINGEYLKAEIHYDLSIAGAHENEYINEEALACERAAYFYMGRGLPKIAATYMTDAIHCYTKWGALTKVKHLEKKYPEYIQEQLSVRRTAIENESTGSSDRIAKSLDISTVIKASQVISSEIHLDKLLKKMLRFSMENAGAERGLLIMEKNGKFFVEAEGTAGGRITVMQSIAVDDRTPYADHEESNSRIPYSIINFIARTGESLILDDAALKGAFTADPYIKNNKVRSLLCAPIMDKGRIAGILYLENNLSSGAFTPDRVELLTVLSAQAAISLENARLVTVETAKAAMDREIEMAKIIQQSLLPSSIPDIKNAHIAFKYVPMMGVGGDFVNIKYLPDAQKLGLFICDVSGHGVPAAMTASIISAALDFYWEDFIDDPSLIFMKMQNFLTDKLGGNFFTACLCTLNLVNGVLTVSSAGHPKLIILKKDGNAGMAVGNGRLITDFIKSNSTNEIISLEKGDRILLYTDGITEAANSLNEMLGSDDGHYCAMVKEQSRISDSPDALCENIYRMVIDFAGSMNHQDDVTMLVCEYGKD
jgi:predicted ATPase/serine phosphatase RsbU (regulator of sigma subunit)